MRRDATSQKGQFRKSTLDHLVTTDEPLGLPWSFGQPGPPQTFAVSRSISRMLIRAQHVSEIGNT